MLGVDIYGSEALSGEPKAVVDALRQHGVLVETTGPAGDTLKIRPPLVFDRSYADILLERLDAVLK